MEYHFRAFSFVDRIVSLQAGADIIGSYHVPAGIKAFPASLAAEAVFMPEELAQIVFAVVTINAWNRLTISSRTPPGSYVR